MFARLSAFVIWSLVAATAVFWVLRLAASPAPVPPYAVAVSKSIVVRGDLARLFGAPPRVAVVAGAAPEAPSRYKLLGVMAPRSKAAQAEEGRGVALIAVDGKPAKAYAIGARLDGDLVLQSVGLRTAAIGTAQGRAASCSSCRRCPCPIPASCRRLPAAAARCRRRSRRGRHRRLSRARRSRRAWSTVCRRSPNRHRAASPFLPRCHRSAASADAGRRQHALAARPLSRGKAGRPDWRSRRRRSRPGHRGRRESAPRRPAAPGSRPGSDRSRRPGCGSGTG